MAEHLWTFRELGEAVGSTPVDGPNIGGIAIDSRRLGPGDLFVALPGDPGPRFTATTRSARDGHDFVDDAVAKGAAALLVHRPDDYRVPALLVDDTLDGLWALGRTARRRLRGPVVAVTGSSGKTTFKSFAARALGAFATQGSLNNHIGVPLSLALTPPDTDAAVFEIGTNHPGEIEPLAKLVRPDVAVVLNVHPAHIEHFGSLAAIRREKLSIANGLDGDGVLVTSPELATDFSGRTVTFGAEADIALRYADASGVVELATPSGECHVPVPGGGIHRATSVAAVAAVLTALGRPLAGLQRLADAGLPPGRGNRHTVSGIHVLDESYNANPASMAATLAAFAKAKEEKGGARRIAILGDMQELGADTERYHADLAPHCALLDGVFCVGARIRALYDALPAAQRLGYGERADDAFLRRCVQALAPEDHVLVKGSNGIFWANGFVAALVDELRRR